MPSIFTPTSAEAERREPGIGGKPPVDRRPTGGGGGGGDDDWKNERRGPRELLHRIRFFVFLFLATDMVFFSPCWWLLSMRARPAFTWIRVRCSPSATGIRCSCRDPVFEYSGAFAEQPEYGMGADEHLFARSMCWRSGSDWASRRCAAPCLGWARRSFLAPCSLRTGDCLEAVDGPGIRLRRTLYAGELFLLHDHRPARCAPGRRRPGVGAVSGDF